MDAAAIFYDVFEPQRRGRLVKHIQRETKHFAQENIKNAFKQSSW